MKKNLFAILVLIIFFSYGCNNDTEPIPDDPVNMPESNTQEVIQQHYLSLPEINLAEDNQGQTLVDNVIYFIDEVNLSIQFKSDIDNESATEKISFNNDNIQIEKLAWSTPKKLDLILTSPDLPEEFSLTINQGLQDINDQILQDDYVISFHKISRTIAEVKLITAAETYLNNTYYHLTDTPKVFQITFTNPVDKASVEKSLKYDLNDKAKIEFTWEDSALLFVSMYDFEYGKYFFNLGAVDKFGFYIDYKDPLLFAFYISPQPRIYSLDLASKELAKLDINFPQDILWNNPYSETAIDIIGFSKTDYIIGYDIYTKRIYYDISAGKVLDLKNEINSDYLQISDIFTDNSYNIINYKLYDTDGELRQIKYDEIVYPEIDRIFSEQEKLIFYKPSSYDYYASTGINGVSLSIYDYQKNELKELQLNIQSLTNEDGPIKPRYVLLNDGKTLIIEGIELTDDAFSSFNNNLNLYKVDIETGELEIFLEKAYFPTYIDNNQSLLLLDSKGHAKIADLEGNIIKDLPIIKQDFNSSEGDSADIVLYCFDIEYKDGNVIGINNENIFIYNINTEEITRIKNEEYYYFIGTGKSKVYLATN